GYKTTSGTLHIAPGDDGSVLVPASAASYRFEWGVFDGQIVDVAPNAVKTIDLWAYAQRRVARLVAPAARDLPNGCRAPANLPFAVNGAWVHDTEPSLVAGTSIEVGANDRVLAAANGAGASMSLTLELPCVNGATLIPLGALGAGPRDFEIGHVDVDDVD